MGWVTDPTPPLPSPPLPKDITLPNMRSVASAVFIGVVTIVASLGPVLVRDVRDRQRVSSVCSWDHPSFKEFSLLFILRFFCGLAPPPPQVPVFFDSNGGNGNGVRNGLLVVVTTCYLTSSVLFAVLGVVIWAGHKEGKLLNNYVSFENEPDGDTAEMDH